MGGESGLTSNTPGQQLALPVNLEVEPSFANYYLPEDSPNLQATRCLYQMACGNGEVVAFIWGGAGVGLSHLLQACASHASATGVAAHYASLAGGLAPSELNELNPTALLCIDDVDVVAGKPEWERAVFHAFNRIKDQGGRIIFASHTPPNTLAVGLPDLLSRLLWGPVYQLVPLDDAAKVRALQLQAHSLGMQIGEDVAQYVVNHSPRGLASLFAVLARLDQETLVSKRRLTIPFIKQVLEL
ncbi:DnaA regulatory inactivator Hda [Halioxenophilus aromaticivorans]|uniref:DnaA regulatory inactivator Hda n=1 Tax=Halioxenophilus aromaticivorans TaxID=1306992 RepID=A0AAV3TZ52_9ALTE